MENYLNSFLTISIQIRQWPQYIYKYDENFFKAIDLFTKCHLQTLKQEIVPLRKESIQLHSNIWIMRSVNLVTDNIRLFTVLMLVNFEDIASKTKTILESMLLAGKSQIIQYLFHIQANDFVAIAELISFRQILTHSLNWSSIFGHNFKLLLKNLQNMYSAWIFSCLKVENYALADTIAKKGCKQMKNGFCYEFLGGLFKIANKFEEALKQYTLCSKEGLERYKNVKQRADVLEKLERQQESIECLEKCQGLTSLQGQKTDIRDRLEQVRSKLASKALIE